MNHLLSRLAGYGLKQVGNNKYLCRCPSHEDKSPSLTITLQPGDKTLIHCFAGCQAEDILGSVDLSMTDLFPDNDDFDSKQFKKKQEISYQREQFMKDYRLVVLAEENVKRGVLLSKQDLKLMTDAQKRIMHYKFNAQEVYEKMIVQDATESGINMAHYIWTQKTQEEKYHV